MPSSSLELPAAYFTFAVSVTAFIWKTVGVAWIPMVGPAFMTIFSDDETRPQYPRRAEDEDFWNVVYLCMYGVLGSLAQWGGIALSKAKHQSSQIENRYQEPASMPLSLRFWAGLYSIFHLIIGCHHLLWSLNKNHGKLELWRYNLPFVYELTGLSALGLCFHAHCILREALFCGANNSMNLQDVRSRKTVMDCCSILTLVSLLVFLVANMMGIETTYESERVWWSLTMYPIPVALLVGTIYRK